MLTRRKAARRTESTSVMVTTQPPLIKKMVDNDGPYVPVRRTTRQYKSIDFSVIIDELRREPPEEFQEFPVVEKLEVGDWVAIPWNMDAGWRTGYITKVDDNKKECKAKFYVGDGFEGDDGLHNYCWFHRVTLKQHDQPGSQNREYQLRKDLLIGEIVYDKDKDAATNDYLTTGFGCIVDHNKATGGVYVVWEKTPDDYPNPDGKMPTKTDIMYLVSPDTLIGFACPEPLKVAPVAAKPKDDDEQTKSPSVQFDPEVISWSTSSSASSCSDSDEDRKPAAKPPVTKKRQFKCSSSSSSSSTSSYDYSQDYENREPGSGIGAPWGHGPRPESSESEAGEVEAATAGVARLPREDPQEEEEKQGATIELLASSSDDSVSGMNEPEVDAADGATIELLASSSESASGTNEPEINATDGLARLSREDPPKEEEKQGETGTSGTNQQAEISAKEHNQKMVFKALKNKKWDIGGDLLWKDAASLQAYQKKYQDIATGKSLLAAATDPARWNFEQANKRVFDAMMQAQSEIYHLKPQFFKP